MAVVLVWFVAAALAIVVAGVILSYTADNIAERTGVGRLTIGVVLLAGATTLPEIITDISAVRIGALDLAVGDIMGSCMMNMLILGIVDLVHHLKHRTSMLSSVVLGQARTATLSMVLIGIVGAAIVSGFTYSVAGVGFGTILALVVYLIGMRTAISGSGQILPDGAAEPLPSVLQWTLPRAMIGFAIGVAIIGVAGPTLARTADQLATVTGLGGTFFGSIVLAFITSLPELVASLAALRMGALDLAVGNLFGSNCFNVAALFIFDAADGRGSLLSLVQHNHALTAFIVTVLTGLAMQATLARDERRVWLVEPLSIAIILAFLAGVTVMYVTR